MEKIPESGKAGRMSPIASVLYDRASDGLTLIATSLLACGMLTRPQEILQSYDGYFVCSCKIDYALSLGSTYGDL